ncbi:GntR family transcriptional regulator [uncultured Corynebacterium sp.]|uniref:GntR family transcriptional regulator n=1 Tax=uncultured Corynebacterium sp. TaxID=159447 RepID=UPI0025FE61A6|nr:GntR family transcriptional regulator [uncultured Corynebacterium sp.]
MLNATPAAERAYAHVKARIISGEFPDTTMLSEGEVAEALGLSRTPIHEAFLRLEVEGFLKLYPKRGALVVPINQEDIREVYEARELVESHCAAQICAMPQRHREDVAALLEGIIVKQRAALDHHNLAGYTELDAVFHQTVMDHGGNSLLAQMGHLLRERQQRFTATAIGRNVERAYEFVDGHTQLAVALAAGDADAYATILTDHLNHSRNQL